MQLYACWPKLCGLREPGKVVFACAPASRPLVCAPDNFYDWIAMIRMSGRPWPRGLMRCPGEPEASSEGSICDRLLEAASAGAESVSMMQYLGQYAAVPIIQSVKGQEEVVENVEQAMMMLLQAYKQRNGRLPQQYVVRSPSPPTSVAAISVGGASISQ